MRNLLAALLLGGTALLPVKADTVDIQLLGINDFHSSLPSSIAMTPEGPVEAGGAEYLAAHMDRLQRDNPTGTLRLAAGDNIVNSPASAVMHDEPGIVALSLMRLDASSVGNHEFDRGLAELRRLENGGCHPIDGCGVKGFKGASFPYLGANIVDSTTGQPAFAPYIVKEVKGVKVGVIGVTHKNSLFEAPSPTAPLQGRDEAETVNAYVGELKAKGVRTIVVLLHQGGGQTGGGRPNQCNNLAGPVKDIVARFDTEVDAVFSAHTHNAYNCVINGIPVTQTSGHSREVTRVNLTVDRATGNPVAAKADNITVTHDIKPDMRIAALRRQADEQAHQLMNRPVGMIARDLTATRNAAGESTIGHALADARLSATSAPENGGAQIAVQPPYGGGIGGDLWVSPTGNDLPNLVTHGEAMRVQQFGNMLVTMTLTGAQVERLLEQQWCGQGTARVLGVSRGLTFTYDNARPACDKIDPATIKLDGAVVDPAGKYRVTANSFIANGGDGFSVLTEGTERVEKVRDIEAFEAHIRASSPLQPPALGRITRLN
ncbi:bifunctional metallophosphatase/5'-nucleotidase [Nonomuraea dietziae]|uniref:bifunctional metallophosphatase/5'-nucleotidase n=1 Tax=Nonomuraea dietziae TaxID=65515 RepID=UPI0033D08042